MTDALANLPATLLRCFFSSSSRPNSPRRLQRILHRLLSKHLVSRQTANTTSSVADGSKLSLRHTATVTPDASRVAHVVRVLELLRGGEVETSEGTGLAERMTIAS
jgi:hypothetical protein